MSYSISIVGHGSYTGIQGSLTVVSIHNIMYYSCTFSYTSSTECIVIMLHVYNVIASYLTDWLGLGCNGNIHCSQECEQIPCLDPAAGE